MCSVSPIELTASKPRLARRRGSRCAAPRRGPPSPSSAIALPAHAACCSRERDAERGDAVVLDGVPHHPAPAAADVEQAHARPEVELAADQVVLGRLRLLEAGVRGRVAGAGVGHRRPEHHLVERVGHVVVVGDRLGVARAGVPQPVDRSATPLRRASPAAAAPAAAGSPASRALAPARAARAHGGRWSETASSSSLSSVVGVGLVDALDGEVALDVGPGQARGRRAR